MNKLITYVKDSFNEVIHNVTWPSTTSLQGSVVLVIIGTFIFGGLIRIMDVLLEAASKFLYTF